MDKEELKKFVNNPDFIPGIYNYCDRWCERCTMATRCSLYAREKEEEAERESDMTNEAYWEQLGSDIALAMELLQDYAEEHDIDLTVESDEQIIQKEEAAREAAENHSASKKSRVYTSEVKDWFEEKEDDIELKTKELETVANLGLEEKSIEEAKEIKNLFEIVCWYQHQIHVKIMRALQSKFDPFEVDDSIQNDANGSAKVAFLGISRSMAAWGKLLNHFPDFEKSILFLLVLLEQTKNHLENAFPKAGDFVRPGFDD